MRELWVTAVCCGLVMIGAGALGQGDESWRCKEWMASIKSYEIRLDSVHRGEPEEFLNTLKKVHEATQAGEQQEAGRLKAGLQESLAGFKKIDPPPGLGEYHRRLLDYSACAVAAADALMRGEDVHCAPVRLCYEALLAYFEELRDLFVDKDCRTGDLEALEHTIIPRLRIVLEKEFPKVAPAENAP